MSSEVAAAESLLQTLIEQDADLNKILSAADRLLSLRPGHLLAQRSRAVCLIQQERFAPALAALEAIGSTSAASSGKHNNHQQQQQQQQIIDADAAAEINFHKAYCQYRLLRYPAAVSLLEGILSHSSNDANNNNINMSQYAAASHLLAQVHYNMENYAAAAAVYEKLLSAGVFRDAQERTELLTNYTAALAALAAADSTHNNNSNNNNHNGSKAPLPTAAEVMASQAQHNNNNTASVAETADVMYNVAAEQIEQRRLPAALETLRRAEALCAREFGAASRVKSLTDALAADAATIAEYFGVSLPKSKSKSTRDGAGAGAGATVADVVSAVPLSATVIGVSHLSTLGKSAQSSSSAERVFFNEVANIWAQMAYVRFLQGDLESAATVLRLILWLRPASAVTAAVAAVTLTAVEGRATGNKKQNNNRNKSAASIDFFESHRRLRSALQPGTAARLSSRQLAAVKYNTALLHLRAKNVGKCRQMLDEMVREAQSSSSSSSSSSSGSANPHHLSPASVELIQSLRLALELRESRKKKKKNTNKGNKGGGEDSATTAADDNTASCSSNSNDAVAAQVREALTRINNNGGKSSSAAAAGSNFEMQQRTIQTIVAQLQLEHNDMQRAADALAAAAVTPLVGAAGISAADLAALPATAATIYGWRLQSIIGAHSGSHNKYSKANKNNNNNSRGEKKSSEEEVKACVAAATELAAVLPTLLNNDNNNNNNNNDSEGTAAAAVALLLVAWAVQHTLSVARSCRRRECQPALHTAAAALVTQAREKLSSANVSNSQQQQQQVETQMAALAVLAFAYTDEKAAREEAKKLLASNNSNNNNNNNNVTLLEANLKESAIEALLHKAPSKAELEAAGYVRATTTAETAEAAAAAAAVDENGDPLTTTATVNSSKNKKKKRRIRHPAKNTEGKIDHERWIPMGMRSYIKDLPPKRRKELRRLRALEQEQKRREAEKRKAAAAAASAAVAEEETK